MAMRTTTKCFCENCSAFEFLRSHVRQDDGLTEFICEDCYSEITEHEELTNELNAERERHASQR